MKINIIDDLRSQITDHLREYHPGYSETFLQNYPVAELYDVHDSEHNIVGMHLEHTHEDGSLLPVPDEDIAYEDRKG